MTRITVADPRQAAAFSKLFFKISLKLTRQQMESLARMMVHFFIHAPLDCKEDGAQIYLVHEIYEKKVRPKLILAKPVYNVSMNVAQASNLWWALAGLNLDGWPYENTLRDFICAEIDRQTV